jgi:hypothetical protein
MGTVLTPILSATKDTPRAYNVGIAETYSWIPIEGEALGRPLYAQANYITNFSDLQVTLSSSEVNIGSVHISDESSGVTVDVVAIPGYGNGLQVLTQDLESTIDDITIGDKQGNFANVDPTLSALDVRVANVTPLTAVISNTVAISTTQTLPISGNVTVANPVTAVNANITNTVSISTAQTLPISGSVTVTNPVTSVNAVVTNTIGVSGSLTVTNPVTSVNATITNTVAISTTQTLPISGSITVLNPITEVTTTPEATQLDAFGRLRTSSPMTLFDSSHRYRDNNLWSSLTAVSASYVFNQNQGLMELNVTGLSGSSVIRETTKVFSYQPGKSLLVMNTFVMASSATNLRQRVGYFGQDNGIYFQLDDGVMSFVERTLVNGSPSSETIVPVSAWNGDKLDGTGPSGFTLDITKAQILWTDIEWLGLGTVRTGFVIDGKFIVCHSFHHANRIASTYITTASLPLRYEITNKAATGVSKTLKQVCSTVISEGGYELRGLQQAVGTPVQTPVDLTTAGTVYTVLSIRLKATPNRLDAIVILTAISLLGTTNNATYNWQVRASGTSNGGTWIDAGVDSAVEYKIGGGTYTGGRILASGYMYGSNQGSTSVDILKEALFKFQLERDALNGTPGTPYELSVVAVADSNGADIHASMDWEEISR